MPEQQTTLLDVQQPSAEPAKFVEVVMAPVPAASTSAKIKPSIKDSDAPLCYNCGNQTQRSGSCYVCTSCGSTTGCS